VTDHHLRIGELSRRVGVSAELLRAWERRYGLLQPERTAGGFRLYSAADERRIRRMQEQLSRGLSAAEAARVAMAADEAVPERMEEARMTLAEDAAALEAALDALDEGAAQAVLDRLLAAFLLETVLGEVILPCLRRLGELWERGEITVGQEHFASNLLRGRLLGAARGWGRGEGPRALLACAPGELHDLPLIAFGLALRGRGWRIAFLGPDTPISTVSETAESLRPAVVVVSAAIPGRLEAVAEELAALARVQPLAVAGVDATESLARRLRCRALPPDPLVAAASVSP
jgi:DNA-binding transcriptional MerR regulator